MTHTDDYPDLEIELRFGDQRLVVRSSSNEEHHLPWQVLALDKSWSTIDANPFRAWTLLWSRLNPDLENLAREAKRENESTLSLLEEIMQQQEQKNSELAAKQERLLKILGTTNRTGK